MMTLGFLMVGFGYALFYWGIHHFIGNRYGLYDLLGFGNIFPGMQMPVGTPIQFKTS